MLTFFKAITLGKGVQGSLQKQKFPISFLSVVWMSCSCLISCEWQVTSRDMTRPQPKSAASADILSMRGEGAVGSSASRSLTLTDSRSYASCDRRDGDLPLTEDEGSCCSWC